MVIYRVRCFQGRSNGRRGFSFKVVVAFVILSSARFSAVGFRETTIGAPKSVRPPSLLFLTSTNTHLQPQQPIIAIDHGKHRKPPLRAASLDFRHCL